VHHNVHHQFAPLRNLSQLLQVLFILQAVENIFNSDYKNVREAYEHGENVL
jgi:hypothetical protein